MADIKSLIDKFNIFRTKDSILNDVAKDNGQITIDIKQPFSDDIDSNNSLKTKLETNIKDKLFNTEINNVGSNIFDEKIKPFDKVYNVSNTPDTDTKTPIDTTTIKPDTPTIEKNTADATNIQQEKTQQPEITTQEPEPEATQQYKIITVLQKPKLTTDSLGNYMPIDFDKRKGKSYSGAGEQQIDMIFNRLDTPEKFDMFMWSVSKAYDQLKSANLNDNENIIFLPYSYDHENGNMNGIRLTFGGRQKEWAEKQLKILAKGINDKQNEEWLSNLELPQPKTTMDKITSKTWLQLFSFMQPPTNEMDPKSASILESGQKENRLNAIKWGLIENIKECKDILDKYYKDKSQVGIAFSVKNITETINNILLPQIDLVKKSEIASIISKYKKNPKSLTPIENEIVKYYSDYVNALSVVANKTSTGYETTKAIETSLPFMADFFRGNLIGNATRGTTRTAMKIGGKGLAREFAKDAPKTFGARALQFGSDVVKSAGHTPLSPLTYTNMLENYSQTMETNGQYTKNDLRRGVIEAFTENFSERMFGALKGILPKSNNAFVNSLFGNNPVIKTMQKHMNVGGLFEETGEEYAGAFVNTMFGFALGDEKLASSFKEQLNNSVPTILSIGITVGLPQAIGMGIDFREIKKMNTRFNVAEDNLKQYFNKENSYIDINRYSDALKSLYINLNNAKYEEDKAEIKGKIAELNKTAANLAMEKGDSNGFNLISEYSIAAQNSFYVTNKAMSELKNMSEEDRTKLSDNAINKLKNDFTNNLNWSLISRAAAKNITDQNGKQHPTCFLYTDNGVTYVLNGQKDNMFYFVDVNGNTISKSADELRNNENLFVLHLNNLLSFSNKELEDINSKFIDIAQYNAGYRYKVNDNGEIRYYTDNKDLINSNTPYERIDRDKIESNLVGSYDLVRIDNITYAVEDMANAFAEPDAEQTSTEQTSTEQQKPAQETAQEQPSEEPIQEQPQEQTTQEPAQEQPSEEPIQEQPQEQTTQETAQEQQIQEQTTEEQETTEQEPIQPAQQQIEPAQEQIEPEQEQIEPIQEQQPAQEEDDSTALNEQENTESQSNEPTTNELDKKSDISVKEQVQASEAEVSAFDRVKNIIIATAQRKERDINGFAHLLRSLSDEELNEALEFVNTKKGRSKIDKINIGELRSHIYYELEERDLSKNLEEAENRGYEYSLKSFENLPADFDYAGYIINHELLAENYEKSGYKGMAAFQRGLIRAVKKLQVQAAEAESRIAQNEQENTESQGKKPNEVKLMNAVEKLHNKAVAIPGYTVFEYRPEYYTDGSGALVFGNKISASVMPIDDIKTETIADEIKFSVLSPDKRKQYKAASKIRMTSDYAEYLMKFEGYSRADANMIAMRAGKELQFMIKDAKNRLVYDMFLRDVFIPLFEEVLGKEELMNNPIVKNYYDGVFDEVKQHKADAEMHRQFAMTAETAQETAQEQTTQEPAQEQQIQEQTTEEQETTEQEPIQPTQQEQTAQEQIEPIQQEQTAQEQIEPIQQEQTAQEEDNSTAQNEQENTKSQGKKPNIRRIGRVIGSSLSTDEFISETMSIVIKDVKTFPKEIRDEDIISKEQKSGKRRAGIKVKVGLLGNDLYIQYREGRSFANKNKELWEKVKRRYWATIKIPNATNYSAGQLRYRLDYAGTTTDIARIVSDAVLELFHKKELRLHKSSGIGNVSIQEAALRDALIDKLREAGIDVITDVEEAQRLLDEANGKEIRQQKTTIDAVIEARDKEYLEAVRNGDLDKAQQMVKEAAKSKGYNSNSDYQGTSAFNGKAPYGNGYFLSKEERKEAWENEEFDGESSLGDYIDNGIDGGNIEYFTSNQNFNHTDDMRREAIENLRNVINGRKRTITMYRSVPSDVKEDSFRNGDWVTPSLSYAIENARIHGWGDNFRIIKQEVSIDDVWFDGNDIAEWGYGREEDFIKDTDFAYKNTKNNRKLLDAVTYDDNGNVIPLSERFNESKSDIRFFRTADGNAYGFTVGGKIYIDPRISTADTPIHEYAHLWASAMQKLNPNEWANIVKLMKGTPIWEEVKRNYPELTTDNEIADEVLAFYSGSRGAERLREEHAKILKGNGNVVKKVKAINAIKRVREALKRFWKNVADWFGIHFTTAEEVADKVLSDLLNGVNPTLAGVENDIRFEENSEEADIVARAKADGTYMKAPNGKKSNLSPRQWVQVRTKAFKDWFGDWENDPDNSSKVVDENGEPMVVYHGFIGKDFNIFDKDVAFDNSRSAKPVYGSFFFSDTRKQAEAYGSFFRKGERVFNGIKATFLNIKNPFIINSENTPYHSVRGYFKNRDTGEIDWNRGGIVKNGWEIGVQDITIAAMEEGYDGVIFRNIDDAGSEELVGTTHTTLAVFSPTQIKSATDNVGTFDQNNPDIRYQFVGEKGAAAMDKAEEATIRLDNLAVARDMEKAGKDAKDIKLATGWERGAEGKWRYEILDLKYFGKGDAGYKKARGKQSWSKELDSLSDRIFNGEELSEEEQKRFEELAKEEENFKTDYLNREKPYLSDWVENDELFKAYPDLKRVQIVFTDQLPTDIGGIYKYNENTIIVNTNYVDNISSVLAHEVQHAIQYIEGFAKGGSEESVQDLFDRAHSEYMARVWADELEEKAKEMGEYYNQTAVYDALVNDYKGFEDYMPNKEERIKGFNYFVRGYADRSLDNLIEKFRANERVSINSYNEYMKLMGEVEARNVQSRLGMSAEERKRSLAIETEDVERKDQIFLEDGLGVSASEVDKETNAANRRASNKSVISSRFERQAEIQREEKNTKSAANIVLGNANVVLNDTNIFDEQYQNAIDNNLIDENVSPLIDSFGITWGYQLKNGVIVINKDVFVSDILDKRVKDNLSLLISSLMKTNKTFFKEGISFFKKLPIWVLYKNDTKSNEDTIKEIINDILLGNTSIDTNKLELLKQYTVQDMNDILDNATKWFEKFEGISSNMFAGNSISDILDTTLGDLMPKEITTTQEGKRLNWFSKLGIDIRSKLFDSLDWFRVVSDKTKDKTASELYDAMIVHTKRVQGKIDIFDKEYVRPIIDTIQSMLGKNFGNSTLSLDLIQEYFAIKSLLGRTASLYKEKFELYLTNHESKKPPMFDEFKQIYDEITEDEIRQRINEMGEKSSMSILQKVDIYYLMEDVRRTLAAEMFVKQYVYSSANTLNQGLQGEQSLGLINEVTNEPYSELYQLLYSDEQSSQTMHSPIEIIEQADILIDRAGLRNEFDFIGNQIQAILNYVNIERVENGLMSYDTFAKRQLMKDFVNQRGENSSEGNLYEITAKQKANEKMKGKDWFNPNSITSIIAVAQTEIATMEKELLAQRLSYFLTNPNNFDVLSQYGMIIDEKETLNEELSEDERNYIMDKNIVLLYGERHTDKNTKGQVDKKKINILKRNDDGTFTKVTISFDNKFIGLEEFVKFVNNNFKYEELRGISKAVAPFTAWTSRIYTILSPLFPTKNLFKDLMVTPWLPAKELNGKNSQYAIKNFYNVFNNLSFILKMSFTEKSFSKKGFENKLKARSQELFEYYLEYSKQHSIFSVEDQIGVLSKENKTLQDIERALSGKENKFIKFTERALLIKFMQHYAELFENLHKFSAYVTLRKLGYGEERSAQIANNATLNYDRSGSIGRQLNAIIPFAKAALGGLYRTNYLLPKYNPKGFLQRVITLAVLGVMQGLMYDPDDDDISEFARKSGMVFGSFLYPLLPEELSIVRPVRALVIVMTGKKSPAYFKQELMESTIDLVPVASDALRGAFSYNPLTNKTEFDVGQLFANTDKMTAVYALAMLASYINENKNSFGKNVLLNEETNTDKTRYGRTKQDYGLYDYLARLYNSILNGVDIDDRAAMSNKIGKNGERLMTIAKEDVEFVINNYIPFGRLYAYTAEIIYDAVNDKRINKGHIPLIGGLFAQKYFGKDYYLVNNIKYELKDFTNDFSQSQIEDIKTNILVKAKNMEGLRYKALKDNHNARPRMLDKAKQKMNDAFNVFILDINNFVNDNGDKKIDYTEDEYKFMLKSFLDSSIMKKALSIGEDTLNKHTAKRVERTYNRYKKHNNENIDTDKENMKDAVKKFKNLLYDKSITEEEFNDKLNSLYEPLFQQIKLRAKFAGYSIE